MCSFNWSYLHHFGTVENFSTAKETDSPAAAWWWVNQAGGRRPKKRSLTVDCCQVMQGGPLVVINGIITPIWVFPKIGGKPPKWMVYNEWKTLLKWDDLGVPLFLETSI